MNWSVNAPTSNNSKLHNMKRLALLPIILLFIFACKDKDSAYRLNGTYGTGNDTLLIFGFDRRHDCTDTIVTEKNGEFNYSLETDTVVPLTLLLPNGELLQVYAEGATSATMQPDSLRANTYTIKGGGNTQFLFDSITTHLNSIADEAVVYEKIDSFIKKHPYSDVNLHLLMKYFVEIDEPKNSFIRERINYFGGTLRDNEHIASLKEQTTRGKGNILHKAFPASKIKLGEKSKDVPLLYKDKYLVLTFWASWDSASVERMRMFSKVEALKDTACIGLLNISFDHDTLAWKKCIEKENIPGDNVCDTKMWHNDIAQEFAINKLPFSILVNQYQRIDKFDVSNTFIEEGADSLVNRVKDNRKKRAEREARQKRVETLKKKRK